MNIPAHIFLGLGILGNRIKPKLTGAIILGSLTPDIPAFIFYFYEKVLLQTPESIIWSLKYHQVHWNYTFDIFHSIPVSFVAALVLFLLNKKWLAFFFAAIFLHAVLDFPLHNQDAHRHFLPFTDYRFYSPISYWDYRYYGRIVMPIEVLISLFFAVRYLHGLNVIKIRYLLYFLLLIYSGNLLLGFFYW